MAKLEVESKREAVEQIEQLVEVVSKVEAGHKNDRLFGSITDKLL